MFSAILAIMLLPLTDLGRSKGLQFRPFSIILFWAFVANFLILMNLGACHVEDPYIGFGQISTAFYFFYFILLGVTSLVENTLINLLDFESKLSNKKPLGLTSNKHKNLLFRIFGKKKSKFHLRIFIVIVSIALNSLNLCIINENLTCSEFFIHVFSIPSAIIVVNFFLVLCFNWFWNQSNKWFSRVNANIGLDFYKSKFNKHQISLFRIFAKILMLVLRIVLLAIFISKCNYLFCLIDPNLSEYYTQVNGLFRNLLWVVPFGF
jgi:hypothetical protein